MGQSKFSVLGVHVNAINYEMAVSWVMDAAHSYKPLSLSALAVHGVMTGVLNAEQGYRLNHLDIVVPDGQPVRWALNLLYRTNLSDRVYGPTLMLKVCNQAAQAGLPIYLYGSTSKVLDALETNLRQRFPQLQIAGRQASQFRQLSAWEQKKIAQEIRESKAAIVFAGLGCPRQEVWVYENRDLIGLPCLAVGAAFDFHAGLLPQAPAWMQKHGLEWLFRMIQEPGRLWKRYVFLNPVYVMLLLLQIFKLRHFQTPQETPTALRYG
ncbi:MAG: WecB/TagA/CpsF family glycosyltransferase [Leptolyngbyaceae cyanobacterium]